MGVHIDRDHPILALRGKVQELSRHFLNRFGFSYFQYLRCFDDGSVSLLTNNTSLMEYFQMVENSPMVFSSFTQEHERKHSYWFLWDEELPVGPVALAREFKIHNGLTLVRRSKTYYDMIAVALPKEQPNAGSFYLNKMKAIEQFIQDFDQDNRDLISLISRNALVLPKSCRDVNYQKICLAQERMIVQGKSGSTYITSQELACLRLLLQGASQKEIALYLELSPRTVETYLMRIKERSGFSSRAALQRMLALCPY